MDSAVRDEPTNPLPLPDRALFFQHSGWMVDEAGDDDEHSGGGVAPEIPAAMPGDGAVVPADLAAQLAAVLGAVPGPFSEWFVVPTMVQLSQTCMVLTGALAALLAGLEQWIGYYRRRRAWLAEQSRRGGAQAVTGSAVPARA